jgi:hypothetical protein
MIKKSRETLLSFQKKHSLTYVAFFFFSRRPLGHPQPPEKNSAVAGQEWASGATRRAKWAKKWFALAHSGSQVTGPRQDESIEVRGGGRIRPPLGGTGGHVVWWIGLIFRLLSTASSATTAAASNVNTAAAAGTRPTQQLQQGHDPRPKPKRARAEELRCCVLWAYQAKRLVWGNTSSAARFLPVGRRSKTNKKPPTLKGVLTLKAARTLSVSGTDLSGGATGERAVWW